MKQALHTLLFFVFATQLSAQTMLDALTHPKFQNPVPSPTKINVGAATTTMQMAQTTQWLGLVSPTNAPLQTTVWGYGLNGGAVSYPGPTLVANSNTPANIEWRNNLPATHLLPVDMTYHQAVATSGIPTVVHLHGGHSEDLSDGQPDAWYTAGYAQKGLQWIKPIYTYDNSQEGSNLWYHDHALGMTRLNVYAGLAGNYRLNDANDLALSLPRGNYDRELMVQDRMFDAAGQLFLPTDPAVVNGGMPEFFGDFILVNGMVWPFMNVEARKYRFRVVNGSDSRVYVFSLSNNAAFLQIGSDGGKFNTPKSLTQLTLAPGERADLIVDFSTMNGQQVTLINSGADTPFGNAASVPVSPTSPTGQIMQFRVNQPRNTAIPDVNITTATNLRPQLGVLPTLAAPNKTRKVALFEGTDDLGRILPMLGIVDPTNHHNGSDLWHDHTTEIVNLNDTETWEVYNTTADAHPIHVHLVSFQILSKQTFTGTLTDKPQTMHNGGIGVGKILSNIALTGAPTTYAPNDLGWKDTHILLPGEMMVIKARFDRMGEYVWHCHILSHEDHDMMRKLVVSNNVPCVGDATPPVLTACPANIALTTTGTTALAPHWAEPTATDNCSTPSVSFTTSPTAGLMHGGAFPIGTTTITYTATDANGNSSMCNFTITVTGPNTNPTSNICTNAAANIVASGNAINVTGITTSSAVVQVLNSSFTNVFNQQITTSSVSIPNLPAGNYLVNVTVLKTGGVWPSLCTPQQNVTVTGVVTNPCTTDVTPPVLTACPANLNVTATGTTGVAMWTPPTATDNCSTPSVSFATSPTTGLTNGGAFPIGTTTVTYMAMDARNNMSTCSFAVNVAAANPCATDNVPPSLTPCPANLNLTTANTTALALWTAPTATDNCSTPSVSFTTSPTTGLTNGGAFPIGTTTVTYKAADARNNTNTCVFNIVVTQQVVNPCATDVTPPVLRACPANLALTTTGTTALATWTAPTATDNCSTPSVSFTTSPTTNRTNGGVFPVGTTTVTYKAIDAKNNAATCSFIVIVTNTCAADVTPPVFTYCPSTVNVPVGLLSLCRQGIWTAPTATDNCSTPIILQTYGPVSGTCFFPSTYPITYTAWDARGNKSTCSFTVNAYKTLGLFLQSNESLVMDAYAEPSRVAIEWVNNTGFKNDFFTLEKANAMGVFEKLEIINNKSNDDSQTQYMTYDNAPTEGENTYRVKVTFQDGTTKISASKTLIFKGLSDVRIFPNPANTSVSLDLSNYKNQAVDVYLYNYLGQVSQTTKIDKVGNPIVELDVANAPVGQYTIRVSAKGKRDVMKPLVIAH